MVDFEGHLFNNQFNKYEDAILKMIQRVNTFLEAKSKKNMEDIAAEESLCKGFKILIAEKKGEDKVAAVDGIVPNEDVP